MNFYGPSNPTLLTRVHTRDIINTAEGLADYCRLKRNTHVS